jgi:hypothetical protein
MESVTRFPEEKLKLRVNRDKSAVAPVGERKFLGHRLLLNLETAVGQPVAGMNGGCPSVLPLRKR